MAPRTPEPSDYRRLAEHISGELVLHGDARYEEARSIRNAMIDKHPAAVLQAKTIADIAPGLAFARDHDLAIAIRGGGHSVAGHGTVNDGLVLNLSACRNVVVDAAAHTVTAEAGATLRDIDAATAAYELAVPMGVVSATGIVGLTLGGGFGWLTRAHGLTIDNLLSDDLITATGQPVHASPSENPDLLWALRVAAATSASPPPSPSKPIRCLLPSSPETWSTTRNIGPQPCQPTPTGLPACPMR